MSITGAHMQGRDKRTYGTLVTLRGHTYLTVDSDCDRVMFRYDPRSVDLFMYRIAVVCNIIVIFINGIVRSGFRRECISPTGRRPFELLRVLDRYVIRLQLPQQMLLQCGDDEGIRRS